MLLINGLGLLILIIAFALFIGFTFLIRRGLQPDLRPVRAFQTLFSQVGQAVESGGRVHLSLGSNSIFSEETSTTLAGLSLLDIVAEAHSISDRSPIASTGDATTMFAINDTIRRAYHRRRTLDKYETISTRPVAFDPMAFAGGSTTIIADDEVRANIMIGSFGPESVLIMEAAHRQNIPQIVGSSRLETQSIGYVIADYPLLGEEYFATRAYVLKDTPTIGSLITQDVLRWVVAALIVIGAILKTFGLV